MEIWPLIDYVTDVTIATPNSLTPPHYQLRYTLWELGWVDGPGNGRGWRRGRRVLNVPFAPDVRRAKVPYLASASADLSHAPRLSHSRPFHTFQGLAHGPALPSQQSIRSIANRLSQLTADSKFLTTLAFNWPLKIAEFSVILVRPHSSHPSVLSNFASFFFTGIFRRICFNWH